MSTNIPVELSELYSEDQTTLNEEECRLSTDTKIGGGPHVAASLPVNERTSVCTTSSELAHGIRRGQSVSQPTTTSNKKKRRRPSSLLHLLVKNKVSTFLRKHGILPPRKTLGRLLTRVVAVLVWTAVVWALVGAYIYPIPVNLDTSPDGRSCQAVPGQVDSNSSSSNTTNSSSSNVSASPVAAQCSQRALHNLSTYLQLTGGVDVPDGEAAETLCAASPSSPQCLLSGAVSSACEQDDLFDVRRGHLFGLAVLGAGSALLGFAAGLVRLPPLVGMLVAGVLLNNVPYLAVARHINPAWSSVIRSVALVIILVRGGISMDSSALRKLFLPVVALGALPCLVEGGALALLLFLILQFTWQWALMTGYLLAAISPAVLVPSLLLLQSKKPPAADDRGLPTMMIVSGAIDDVISIALFGVFLGLAFSADTSLALSILRGPMEVLLGVAFGALVGGALWYLPPDDSSPGSLVRNRFFLLLGFSLFALFGAQLIKIGGTGFVGAGALAILVLAFVVNLNWKRNPSTNVVKRSFLMVWLLVQPFLFGLIGAAVDVYTLDLAILGQCVAVVVLGLVVRTIVVLLVTLPLRLSWKQQLFCCMSWVPKATVQAALAGVVTDVAAQSGRGSVECSARLVLTLAVLEIVIAAPLGATLIGVFGPALLYNQPLCARRNQGRQDNDSIPEDGGVPSISKQDGDVPSISKQDEDVPSISEQDGDVPSISEQDADVPSISKQDGDVPTGPISERNVPSSD